MSTDSKTKRNNRRSREDEGRTREDAQERARELGMGLGVAAYNDALGQALGDGPVGSCPYCLRDYGRGHHCCACY